MSARLAFTYLLGAVLLLPVFLVMIVAGIVNISLQTLAWPFCWLQEGCERIVRWPAGAGTDRRS